MTPEIIKTFEVEPERIVVNGEPFPYAVAMRPITTETEARDGVTYVTLTLLVENFSTVGQVAP